ncbi:hypothetical protein HK099_008478 [Clydaea vesicula]|uniref:G domain-containing protein n=1 Tax=Clydaea vesicula TaxID=447962 RepID=A0AAD5U049_9FUNG|nr:hypothetical protein HK099_008478 [Clydaea vesicula]
MSRNTKELEDYVLLIGNPGVGKSTLINGLLGEAVFKSGISKLEGLTQFFQQKRGSDGVIYADTPGLADAVLRERAGEEALQQNGVYKIFFVVNLMSGRVMTSDLATVDAVMNAIKIPNVTYSIIVNKLTRGEQRKGLANNHEEYSHYFQLKNFKAPKIFFFNHDDILDGSDNAIFDESDNSKALKSFISSAPRITIQATQVDTITLKDYEEKILGLENLLQKKTAEFQALFDQQKKAFKEQIRIEKEEAEKAKKVEIEKKKREEAERIKLLQEKTAEFQALFDQQKKAFN